MQAEKRELTILFCDVLGSTALAEQLPLEDFLEVIRGYHHCVYESITTKYGFVAQYLGDGVMAYFGYPTAFEAAPAHAVASGLKLLDDIQAVKGNTLSTFGVDLNIRISIHTGTVVMADLGLGNRKERLALGEAPNISARLQRIAPENGIAVSEATYTRTQGLFTYESLGQHQLKGLSAPIQVYRPMALQAEQSC